MDKVDITTLKKLLTLSDENTLKLATKFLEKYYTNVIKGTEFIMAIGDIPILLIAHVDTVHINKPNNIFYDSENEVMWSPDGLGADDRAGVYAIFHLLRKGYRPHVLFTNGEEIGGLGALEIVDSLPKPPCEIKYIIELDRAGYDDCVFYNCANIKFITYIESFGFNFQKGSFTDISFICPEWKIAGVNLSIGYRSEHSYEEHLYLSNMIDTIRKVENMLNCADVANTFEYIPAKTKSLFKSGNSNICINCGKAYPKFTNVTDYNLCGKCLEKVWMA